MSHPGRLFAVAAVAAGLLVAVAPSPAEAGVIGTTSGTTATFAITGDTSTTLGCTSGSVSADGVAASPALACATVTAITVTGDAGAQSLFTRDLNSAATFAAVPTLAVDLGAGNDAIHLATGGPDRSGLALGAGGTDTVWFEGSASADTLAVASASPNVSILATSGAASATTGLTSVEILRINGYGGNDDISLTGVTAGSALTFTSVEGGLGNDTLTAGTKPATLYGGAGTNTLAGGAGDDSLWSESDTDTIDGGFGADFLYDAFGLRSGGRTITAPDTADTLYSYHDGGDAVVRYRPDGSTGTLVASLTRPGVQVVPPSLATVSIVMSRVGEALDRGLVDVEAGDRPISAGADGADDDIIDITIPSGGWTTSGIPGINYAVIPTNAAYRRIDSSNFGDTSVHGPWTDRRQGFGHRVIRDLYLRFPTDPQRDAIRDDLAAGTRTRAQITAALVDTDEYRGLDVDRSFLKFLRRPSDAGGRTYWIGVIRGGRSLQKFRAQLFGSNEYFTKAGGTNDRFVEKAYQDVLGRLPDPGGRAFWVSRITSGLGRGSVAEQFLASSEARRAIVTDQHLRFLGRPPTPAESTPWVTALGASATGEQQLVAALAASAEYYGLD